MTSQSHDKWIWLLWVTIFLLSMLGCGKSKLTETSSESAGIETMSGTEMTSTEMAGIETMSGTEMAGTEMAGTEMAGTEMAGTEIAGTETAGTEMAGTEMAGTEIAGTEMAGTETAGTEMAGTEFIGHDATSCGSPDQGLNPVDCTQAGDVNSACVFSNHCMCSEGYVCENNTLWPNTSECDPGSICIPEPMIPIGASPQSCGAPEQDLDPVDCTVHGDLNSVCVFSNHCLCSGGYICDDSTQASNASECDPGSVCIPDPNVPRGFTPQECGAPDQGLVPVDCTAAGDLNSMCVFSNHCACSEGYVCQSNIQWPDLLECDPGSICVPIGVSPQSCGVLDQDDAPINCTLGGDLNATCVYGHHCMCSEGYICENEDMLGQSECQPGNGCILAR